MVISVTDVYPCQDASMATAMRASNVSAMKDLMDSSVLNQSALLRVTRNVDIAENQANAGARLGGGETIVRNVFLILDVSMEHVGDHGNATVRRVGEECFAMKTPRPHPTSRPTTVSNATELFSELTTSAYTTESAARDNATTTTLKSVLEGAEEKPSDNET
ncbi:unnamed protein product [Acanthoscelides obtectus]|uniref:Uncharacterized protein n=1 Tax=Acanthoscelides obtectus TaxID=200917 RepID=A0A9P0P379_ACAOB|nr:unnamed protein product [Acanthoscelides obtectus]CAK1646188.1 hypothetical protein AOBTE_LOCUS14506 [Acanthoscelides obtectus]